MMSEDKAFLTVAPLCTEADSDHVALVLNTNPGSSISVDAMNTMNTDISVDTNSSITATLASSPEISSSVTMETKSDIGSGLKLDSISDLGSSGSADMAALLNRNIRTHVASDVNLGSLGDLSDGLAVSDAALDTQLKDESK